MQSLYKVKELVGQHDQQNICISMLGKSQKQNKAPKQDMVFMLGSDLGM
jgi:hypothetical protein